MTRECGKCKRDFELHEFALSTSSRMRGQYMSVCLTCHDRYGCPHRCSKYQCPHGCGKLTYEEIHTKYPDFKMPEIKSVVKPINLLTPKSIILPPRTPRPIVPILKVPHIPKLSPIIEDKEYPKQDIIISDIQLLKRILIMIPLDFTEGEFVNPNLFEFKESDLVLSAMINNLNQFTARQDIFIESQVPDLLPIEVLENLNDVVPDFLPSGIIENLPDFN